MGCGTSKAQDVHWEATDPIYDPVEAADAEARRRHLIGDDREKSKLVFAWLRTMPPDACPSSPSEESVDSDDSTLSVHTSQGCSGLAYCGGCERLCRAAPAAGGDTHTGNPPIARCCPICGMELTRWSTREGRSDGSRLR